MEKTLLKKLIITIILSILAFSTANAAFEGFPYLCPEGVDTQKIYEDNYNRAKEIYSPNSDGTCLAERIDCETLYQNYAEEQTEIKVQSMTQRITNCEENFRKYLETVNKVAKIDIYSDNYWQEYQNLDWFEQDLEAKKICQGAFIRGAPDCTIENYDSELMNALKHNEWNQNFCNFLKSQYQITEEIERKWETCQNSCSQTHNLDKLSECSGYSCLTNNCGECTDPDIYEQERNKYSECFNQCQIENEKDREKLENTYYANCAAESYFSYFDDALTMYIGFYSGWFSYSEEDSKYYIKRDEATFYTSPLPIQEPTCPEGFFYDGKACAPDINEQESVILEVNQEEINYPETQEITGQLLYQCSEGCSGMPAVIEVNSNVANLNFEIEYDSEKPYLSKSTPIIKFTIKPIISKETTFFDTQENTITIISKDVKKEVKFNFEAISNLELTTYFSEPVQQGRTVEFEVEFDGPQEYEYTYILSSALDATFYVGEEEYPLSAIVRTTNTSLSFEWQTPQISREVNVREYYLDELGQLSLETLSTVTQTVSFMAMGDAVKAFIGKSGDAMLDEVNSNMVDLGFGTGDVLLTTWTSMDPIPTAISIDSVFRQNPVASTLASISYSTYSAYDRASNRLHAFSSDKTHIYDVPIKIVIKPKGYKEAVLETKIQVEAPEVIYK